MRLTVAALCAVHFAQTNALADLVRRAGQTFRFKLHRHIAGESEAKMRTLFADAAAAAPAIVFIDEIDVIGAKRETAQREMERRIVAQLVTCMDDLSAPPPSASLVCLRTSVHVYAFFCLGLPLWDL
jgi:SpoVK/Ycf46/Vps4 family AAA+-type ATPase